MGRNRCDDSAVREGVGTRPWIVDDGLWAPIEPLLPPWPERSPGPVPDRLCLQSRRISQERVVAALSGWSEGRPEWKDTFMRNNVSTLFEDAD